ncbi:MAG: CoA transferase [Gammaproteobacteria bacterium]|nr:CoA transferase [Gammaproteobacteria bacterium]
MNKRAMTLDMQHPRGNRAAGESWIAIGVETEAAWGTLAGHMGVDDPRFADIASRKANAEALDGVLARWCPNLDAEETAATLSGLGVCAAIVSPFDALYEDPSPNFLERGFTVPVTRPESGTHFLPLAPWLLSARTRPPTRYSPRFGEHSREVLRTELGITDGEYEELEALGVTGMVHRP